MPNVFLWLTNPDENTEAFAKTHISLSLSRNFLVHTHCTPALRLCAYGLNCWKVREGDTHTHSHMPCTRVGFRLPWPKHQVSGSSTWPGLKT